MLHSKRFVNLNLIWICFWHNIKSLDLSTKVATISLLFVRYICFSSTQTSTLKQQRWISPEPGRSSKLTQVLKLTHVHFRRLVSCPLPPRPCHWNSLFVTVYVVRNERAGQLTAGDIWTLWVSAPYDAREFLCSFVGCIRFPVPEHQNENNIYVCKHACMCVMYVCTAVRYVAR